MHIYVEGQNEKTISIRLPTRLFLNGATATIGTAVLKRYVEFPEGVKLSGAQLRSLFREIHRCRKRYPGLYLVDIESADGSIVKVKL